MTTFNPSGIIRITTDYVPAEGVGARIAPATYAGDEKVGRPAGAAWTESTPVRTIADNGDISLGDKASACVIDSQAAQTTRAENALWDMRDELDLPGIVIKEADNEVFKEAFSAAFDKALKANKIDANYDKDSLMEDYLARLNFKGENISSWTLPHRHIDGTVRIASTESNGSTKSEVWKEKGELYNKIISASPQNLETLMKLSPNSLLYGFWLSSGAPLLHKVPRSYTYDIVGYGASKVSYGATKMSTMPTDASLRYAYDKNGDLVENTKGLRASEMLLGSVPAFSTAHITSESIVGSGAITTGALWASINKDKHNVSIERKQAAFDALVHIGILGYMLASEEWTLRSGCTLIPEKSFFTAISPQGQENLEFGSVEDFKAQTIAAVKRAQELDIFGSAEDRETVYAGRSIASVSTSPFVSSL